MRAIVTVLYPKPSAAYNLAGPHLRYGTSMEVPAIDLAPPATVLPTMAMCKKCQRHFSGYRSRPWAIFPIDDANRLIVPNSGIFCLHCASTYCSSCTYYIKSFRKMLMESDKFNKGQFDNYMLTLDMYADLEKSTPTIIKSSYGFAITCPSCRTHYGTFRAPHFNKTYWNLFNRITGIQVSLGNIAFLSVDSFHFKDQSITSLAHNKPQSFIDVTVVPFIDEMPLSELDLAIAELAQVLLFAENNHVFTEEAKHIRDTTEDCIVFFMKSAMNRIQKGANSSDLPQTRSIADTMQQWVSLVAETSVHMALVTSIQLQASLLAAIRKALTLKFRC